MTLKETDNHSAQAIFESLMLDPDLEIGEGQTREEARQHFNNMRALSLGTEESSIKSLLNFLSRPSSIISTVVDLVKASLGDVTNPSYYEQYMKVEHPHAESEVSLSEEGNKFIHFLQHAQQPNGSSLVPAATLNYVKSLAKAWRADDPDGANEDGWIKHVAASIGTHGELSTQLSNPNNGGFSP